MQLQRLVKSWCSKLGKEEEEDRSPQTRMCMYSNYRMRCFTAMVCVQYIIIKVRDAIEEQRGNARQCGYVLSGLMQ